jgi:hypothetical protein
MSLIPVFHKNSPQAHTESELDLLGVHGKLAKYVVHSSKRKNWKKYFSSHKLPKQQSTSFWSQGILGVRKKIMGFWVVWEWAWHLGERVYITPIFWTLPLHLEGWNLPFFMEFGGFIFFEILFG